MWVPAMRCMISMTSPGTLSRRETPYGSTTTTPPATHPRHITSTSHSSVSGSFQQPIRLCGIPDSRGVKPIIDGSNATTRADENWASGWIENLAIIAIHNPLHKWGSESDLNRNIIIEGLHLRNAGPAFSYHRQSDSGVRPYDASAACINVASGLAIVVRGNELENCSQAVFSNARIPGGSMVDDLTIEGNYIHHWGLAGNIFVHGVYLQAVGLQLQFNYFGTPEPPGASSNLVKSRSVLQFLRWNYLQSIPTTGRAFDLVEPQAFVCYVVPMDFSAIYHGDSRGSECAAPGSGASQDPTSADRVAANFEAYHTDYIYGNILDDGGSRAALIHYGFDQSTPVGPAFNRRGGTLYYWNNTQLLRAGSNSKVIFDPVSPDTFGHSYEFPVIKSVNNIFAAENGRTFQWTTAFWPEIIVNSNWINPSSGLPSETSRDSYQGGTSISERAGCHFWIGCRPGNGHLRWARNGRLGSMSESLYTGPMPFDAASYRPRTSIRGLAAALPDEILDQPSNMEYFPAENRILPRTDLSFLGALD